MERIETLERELMEERRKNETLEAGLRAAKVNLDSTLTEMYEISNKINFKKV